MNLKTDLAPVKIIELGTIDYKQGWDYQEQLFAENVAVKIELRKRELSTVGHQPPDDAGENGKALKTTNYLIFCEHPHVYTLGKSGKPENLLVNDEQLKAINAAYYKINRGGDITYHGPGQLVMYPIFDLETYFFTDIHKFLRLLEEAVILTLDDFGIKSGRIEGLTGVWIDGNTPEKARKICAMGIRCSRWVTMHGIALNVNTNLAYFNNIIPCGIDDKAVTSMEKELNRKIDMTEVKEKLLGRLSALFGIEFMK